MATAAKALARPLDWPGTNVIIALRGGQHGRYIGECAVTGKRKVQTFKYRGSYVAPPRNSEEARDYVYTTWLLDDAGRCRGDLAPCEQDWLGERA